MRFFATGNAGSLPDSIQAPAIRTISANTTLGLSDYAVRVNTASGNVTVTLPTGAGFHGLIYQIKKVAASNTMTVASAANIDGQSSIALTANNSNITVQYDHPTTSWNIL